MRLLSGDDLCGFHGRVNMDNGNPEIQFDLPLLQVLGRRTAAGVPRKPQPEGVLRTIRPKPVPSRLDPVSYERLRRQILRRDGWRCQSCGTTSNLEDTPRGAVEFLEIILLLNRLRSDSVRIVIITPGGVRQVQQPCQEMQEMLSPVCTVPPRVRFCHGPCSAWPWKNHSCVPL